MCFCVLHFGQKPHGVTNHLEERLLDQVQARGGYNSDDITRGLSREAVMTE